MSDERSRTPNQAILKELTGMSDAAIETFLRENPISEDDLLKLKAVVE